MVSRFNSFHLTLLPLARVQSLPRAVLSRSFTSAPFRGLPLISSLDLARDGPPMEFLTLWRHEIQVATYTGFTSPGCAAPSGFLNLSAPCSTQILSALFHADTTQVSVFRGCTSAVASCASRRRLPLLLFTAVI